MSPGFNLAQVHETVEGAVPERPCIIDGARTLTYAEVGSKSRRLANLLVDHGLGNVVPRAQLLDYQSGADHLGILLHNSPEYLVSMLGAFKARVVPFNINYRYVADELAYLLTNSGAKGLVFQSAFAPVVAAALSESSELPLLIQVPDDSGEDLLSGAVFLDEALDGYSDTLPASVTATWSADDLYMLYTGGTTGAPKGVIWRQDDIFVSAMGGRRLDTNRLWKAYHEIADHALEGGARVLATSPFMHGAAHWLAFSAFTNGDTVVIPRENSTFDARITLDTIEQHGVEVLLIVGDAFGRPLVEELERTDRYLDSLLVVVSGGATLSEGIKKRLIAALPNTMVLDGLGASETGTQASQLSAGGQEILDGAFAPGPGTAVVSFDLTRLLEPGDSQVGWLAKSGYIPLGYLDDPERTEQRFVTISGTRFALSGDHAAIDQHGRVLLKGRHSSVINSGGEKIYAAEVEAAILTDPRIRDCVVIGVTSQRWGEEVVALVETDSGVTVNLEELCSKAGASLARYKLPKRLIVVERLQRLPAGKPDLAWARRLAAETPTGES